MFNRLRTLPGNISHPQKSGFHFLDASSDSVNPVITDGRNHWLSGKIHPDDDGIEIGMIYRSDLKPVNAFYVITHISQSKRKRHLIRSKPEIGKRLCEKRKPVDVIQHVAS